MQRIEVADSVLRGGTANHTRSTYNCNGLNVPKLFIAPNVSSSSLATRWCRCSIAEPVGFHKRLRRGFHNAL
jgi:hypothetical protein